MTENGFCVERLYWLLEEYIFLNESEMCLLSKNIDSIGVEFEEENYTCFLSKNIRSKDRKEKF